MFGQLAGQPVILRGKNFNVGHYTQIVQPYYFMPPMLIIDIYYFTSPSQTLTLD